MGNFTIRVFVCGRVQGVYYRAFAQNRARQIGLTGYARNLPDSSVEVYAEGKKNSLEQLLEFLKEGPPGARVDDIEVTWSESGSKFGDFSITA